MRCLLRDVGVLRGVPGIHRVDGVRGHAYHRLAFGKGLRQLDLHRVDARDVMHDHANVRPSLGMRDLPFRVREAACESDQGASALFETVGEGVGELRWEYALRCRSKLKCSSWVEI